MQENMKDAARSERKEPKLQKLMQPFQDDLIVDSVPLACEQFELMSSKHGSFEARIEF